MIFTGGMAMFEVACLGILVADVIAKPVVGLPERGKLGLVDEMSLHSGGCAMNTGNALGKLGVKTAVLGKVGDDGFGDFLVKRLAAHGVNIDGVVKDTAVNTSATMVMLSPDGERTFIHYIGANAVYGCGDVRYDIIQKSKILHLAGYYLMPSLDGEPSAEVLKKAKAMGVTTSLDTCWDSKGRWLSLLEGCLPHLDYFLPSIEEAKMITSKENPRDIAAFLIDKGVGTVALKMGEKGCFVKTGDTEITVPPFRIDPVDATGAGDSFIAGFLAGVVRGFDLEQTALLANGVGACCVRGMGASSGILSWDETLEFVKNNPKMSL
jgi:sugar/nucleoside kinase (ribokinase family)